jgi:hypothetical protein
MYWIGFEYDNKRLSDFGCVICTILGDNGVKAVNVGSKITFNTVQNPNTNKFNKTSTQYTEAYTTTFEVCKNPCNANDNEFTPEEMAYLIRWLNKEKYKKFKPVYKNGELANIYYNASMNCEPISSGGKIIGLQLVLQTDAPFAYYDEVEYTMEFTTNNLTHSYFDVSDKIGYIYPSSMIIDIQADGDFKLSNSQAENETTIITNCKSGEKITIVENKVITSSMRENLYNNFNFTYPKIGNDYQDVDDEGYYIDNMENIFSVTIPCTITFKYSPICKMGLI